MSFGKVFIGVASCYLVMSGKGIYIPWSKDKVLLDELAMAYVRGLRCDRFIDFVNNKYGTTYSYESYKEFVTNKSFKRRVEVLTRRLQKETAKRVVKRESKALSKNVVNSKDVLRATIIKLGNIMDKVDKCDEGDAKLINRVVRKYGSWSSCCKVLNDLLKHLNELEGSGEVIDINSFMKRFKRNKHGRKVSKGKSKVVK